MVKKFPRRRRVWLRCAAAAMTLVAVTAGLPSSPAQASENHFIKISTHGAPIWSSAAFLFAADGKTQIHYWHESHIGNYAYWQWNWGGDRRESIHIYVKSEVDYKQKNLQPDQNHCFLVNAIGQIQYSSGSSCNPA